MDFGALVAGKAGGITAAGATTAIEAVTADGTGIAGRAATATGTMSGGGSFGLDVFGGGGVSSSVCGAGAGASTRGAGGATGVGNITIPLSVGSEPRSTGGRMACCPIVSGPSAARPATASTAVVERIRVHIFLPLPIYRGRAE